MWSSSCRASLRPAACRPCTPDGLHAEEQQPRSLSRDCRHWMTQLVIENWLPRLDQFRIHRLKRYEPRATRCSTPALSYYVLARGSHNRGVVGDGGWAPGWATHSSGVGALPASSSLICASHAATLLCSSHGHTCHISHQRILIRRCMRHLDMTERDAASMHEKRPVHEASLAFCQDAYASDSSA